MISKVLLPLVIVGWSGVVAPSFADASAEVDGEKAGPAVIVSAGLATRELSEGDELTAFSLRLPEGASCPGDSANDGYRFHSFMVPTGTDVGLLTYDNVRPLGGELNYPIRTPLGDLFVHQLLAPNPGPGIPGLIPIDFALTFGGWAEGLTPGRYKVGIACTDPEAWAVVRYWETEGDVEMSRSSEANPQALEWKVVGGKSTAEAGSADDGPAAPTALIALGVVGALSIIVMLWRRLVRRSETSEGITV